MAHETCVIFQIFDRQMNCLIIVGPLITGRRESEVKTRIQTYSDSITSVHQGAGRSKITLPPKYAINHDRTLDKEKLLCYDFYSKETPIFIGLDNFFPKVSKKH